MQDLADELFLRPAGQPFRLGIGIGDAPKRISEEDGFGGALSDSTQQGQLVFHGALYPVALIGDAPQPRGKIVHLSQTGRQWRRARGLADGAQ